MLNFAPTRLANAGPRLLCRADRKALLARHLTELVQQTYRAGLAVTRRRREPAARIRGRRGAAVDRSSNRQRWVDEEFAAVNADQSSAPKLAWFAEAAAPIPRYDGSAWFRRRSPRTSTRATVLAQGVRRASPASASPTT